MIKTCIVISYIFLCFKCFFLADFLFNFPYFSKLTPLFAYIGPGMGGGVIAAIFGIIAAFFLGLWGILYYPIKRAFKNKKKNKKFSKKKNNFNHRK